MDFSSLLSALNQASGFELYRLRAAIDRVLDEPRWITAIAQRLQVGQRIEYFDSRANASRHGKVLEMRRKQVLILDEDDGKRWLIPYTAINLDGADVRIRERKEVGLGRQEIAEGDMVGFLDHDKRERSGIVQRLNDKTVTVLSQGQKWRVAYSLLHRVVEIPAEEIRQSGVIGT
jgi:hypothetical protein